MITAKLNIKRIPQELCFYYFIIERVLSHLLWFNIKYYLETREK